MNERERFLVFDLRQIDALKDADGAKIEQIAEEINQLVAEHFAAAKQADDEHAPDAPQPESTPEDAELRAEIVSQATPLLDAIGDAADWAAASAVFAAQAAKRGYDAAECVNREVSLHSAHYLSVAAGSVLSLGQAAWQVALPSYIRGVGTSIAAEPVVRAIKDLLSDSV